MRAPTVKRLLAAFPDLERASARLIRKLAKATDDRDALAALIEKHCPATHAYARSCFNDPFASRMWRVTMALHAIDTLLGTHGVESLGEGSSSEGFAPPFEYCNAGDSYAATLVYKRASDRLFVGCWGDIAERFAA